jgi:hypothetical protein
MIIRPHFFRFHQFIFLVLLCVMAWVGPSNASEPPAMNMAAAKRSFQSPGRDFASAPLWVWNDLLTETQIRETMRDLAAQQVKQVFVHPRPGLMTPYLSDDWFQLWKVALSEAERLDMNVWIYDENSYPSGFAGGWVPKLMPEARGRGLAFRETTKPPGQEEACLAVYRLTDRGFERIKLGQEPPEARYLVATVVRSANSPWHGGESYVDLMHPGVTERFLELTLEPYRRAVGDQFGRRIPGVFTDEPNVRPAGGMPWTDSLPAAFKVRWGYDLMEHLPSLRLPVGDWKRVRHNYFRVVHELFVERWAKPYHDYCATNRLEFTGHYWDHEWPNCLGVPDNMAMYAWHQRPAIDVLMNQYQENTHAQFGNIRMVKELSSVANQLGLPRTLCEAYGAGGWDLRFEDMKRIGDWIYVLGVNTLDEHLSYITLRGSRKRDHPQSFSYHEPWWPAYHVVAQYFTRLSAALSSGQQVNSLLVWEPTTTAWCYNTDGQAEPKLAEMGNQFFDLLKQFESEQIEYDLGCEDIIARHGLVFGGKFWIGRRCYDTVVLPPGTENLDRRSFELLVEFASQNGRVLCLGDAPTRVDGQLSPSVKTLTQAPGWQGILTTPTLAQWPMLSSANTFFIERQPRDQGILFHHRRQLDDGELLFLVNTSPDSNSKGWVNALAAAIQEWDLETGRMRSIPLESHQGRSRFEFDLPPAGSRLFALMRRQGPSVTSQRASQEITLDLAAPIEVARAAPNVLVLDYVDLETAGETSRQIYFYQANRRVFQKHGMPFNPWDNSVQLGDVYLKKTFPPESGFTVSYAFKIDGSVPPELTAVIERPDLYRISCNGQPLDPIPGKWWLDKSFGCLNLTQVARVGSNTLTLVAHPFSIIHEIEPVYLLGDFSLLATEAGYALSSTQSMRLGPWNKQGCPFYSSQVLYRSQFASGPEPSTWQIELGEWSGSVATVSINGHQAGHIWHKPWRIDVTPWVMPGMNRIEVSITGTLKNTLGPHHNGPGVGSAWPGMFHKAPDVGPPPGAQYATLGYGLSTPFKVLRKENTK